MIEAATGQPIAGVTVQINPMGAAFNSASVGSGQADKQGEWVIEAAWPGPYSVVANLSRSIIFFINGKDLFGIIIGAACFGFG